jgi:hypothetical protein
VAVFDGGYDSAPLSLDWHSIRVDGGIIRSSSELVTYPVGVPLAAVVVPWRRQPWARLRSRQKVA